MGTKNQPQQNDTYEVAEPDEPLFCLVARDPLAPALVEAWAAARRMALGPDDPEEAVAEEMSKIHEAEACALAMRDWKMRNPGRGFSRAKVEAERPSNVVRLP